MTDTITIAVDRDLADAYRAASDQDRRKLDLLLNLRLRDVTRTGVRSNASVASRKALIAAGRMWSRRSSLRKLCIQSASDRV